MTAVIFDFNGTMFFDSDKHEQAWRRYLEQELGKRISRQTYQREVHGKDNADIVRYFWGAQVSAEEISRRSEEKESLYRELCLADKAAFHLAGGLPEFLDALQEQQTPVAIATTAELANVRFYFEHFGLGRWFQPGRVVYQDGSFPGKPNPAIYRRAASALDKRPEECLVFEDSGAGITAARQAGCGAIACVAPADSSRCLAAFPFLKASIPDFRQRDFLLSLLQAPALTAAD